eukprot:scaffold95944_cov33-Tisochrysis_lutea.AAC.2
MSACADGPQYCQLSNISGSSSRAATVMERASMSRARIAPRPPFVGCSSMRALHALVQACRCTVGWRQEKLRKRAPARLA